MKLNQYLLLASPLLTGALVWAQPSHNDPLGENLFPPELIVGHGEAIGLSDDQRTSLLQEIQKAHERFSGMHEKMQKEIEALGALLKKERVDEGTALAQFDKVLNQEREIKRAHLALVLGLKNKLSAEQQAKLQEIKKRQPNPEGPPAAIVEKLKKVQAGVQKWQDEGRDPSPVAELMQGFEPLMKQGKLGEAQELLDNALKILGREEKK